MSAPANTTVIVQVLQLALPSFSWFSTSLIARRRHAHALVEDSKSAYGAFQAYSLHNHKLVSSVPSTISFEQAAVLPLAVSTAAAGLYEEDSLKLRYPSINPTSTGEVLLVWGGSSSVGALTIQLAKASGYEVVTTASARNFDLVKSLGADAVFDYNSKTVVDEIVDYFKGKTVAGAYDAIAGNGSTEASAEILSRSKGGKHVACVLQPPEKLAEGVTSKWFYALNILKTDTSKAVWIDYLPEALKQGKIQAKPDPLVAGKGIAEVQKAVDRQAEGVSAQKVVCTI